MDKESILNKKIDTVVFKYAVKVKGDTFDYFEIPVKEMQHLLDDLHVAVNYKTYSDRNRVIKKILREFGSTERMMKDEALSKKHIENYIKSFLVDLKSL